VNVTADAGSALAARRAAWERNVADSWMIQNALFKEIEDLSSKPDGLTKALEKARAGLQRTEADIEALKGESAALAKEGGAAFRPHDLEVQRIKVLDDGKRQLENFLKKHEEIERTVSNPKEREWLKKVEEARLYEKDAEIKKAIDIYKKVLEEGLDSPEVQKHLEQLEKAWTPADDKHDEARRFIYNVWPKLDTRRLKEQMGEAVNAFAECRKHRDVYGPLRLFKATEAHAVRLKRDLDALNPSLNPDDEKPAEEIKEVSAGLIKLAGDIQIYLEKERPPGN
jgi:hypothetical protein